MTSLARLLAFAFLAALGPFPEAARADDEPAEPPPEAEETPPAREPRVLRAIDDEEAKPLVEALKKVEKKKAAADITPALDAIEEVHHPDLEKSLLRLLGHDSPELAARVAGMWEGRIADEKCADRLWKAAWADKRNDKRFVVKAKALRAMGAAGIALDKRQYDEVERDWRWMVGNPNEAYAEALIDLCAYFEATKDKRHCRWMAQELDEPIATDPNSPTNPPAEWWERRHKMWRPTKPACVAALKALTGQEFDKTADAKAWFEANRKAFGFEW
jgi:hypothetical protein